MRAGLGINFIVVVLDGVLCAAGEEPGLVADVLLEIVSSPAVPEAVDSEAGRLAEEVCADVSCEETVCTGAVSAPDFRTGDSPMKSAAAMANTVMATATPVF